MLIPEKMKAAILVEQQKPLVIDEIELPSELSTGQVLVKVWYSGICGSQLGEISGVKGKDNYLPHLLGHEGSGIVVDIGPEVKHVKPGDKVVLHWRPGHGLVGNPPTYQWNGKKLNAGWVTTFNEYAIVSENRITLLPDDCDMDVAALFGCAVTTGFGVAVNNAGLRIGDAVVVYGAGGVGLNIIQAAAMMSAYPVIAVDLYDGKLELAASIGATHTINAKKVNAEETIQSITKSRGLDVFIDNTGIPEIIELGYRITKPQGRIVLVGVPMKGNNISIYSLPLHFGKKISGSHGGEALPAEDIPRYYSLYQEGQIKLKELITDVYTLNNINDALDNMRNGSIKGRCLIKM